MKKIFLVLSLLLVADSALGQITSASAKRIQKLATGPTCNSSSSGTIYYDTDDNLAYVCNGSSYVTHQLSDTDLTNIAALSCSSGQLIQSGGSNTWSCVSTGQATRIEADATDTIDSGDGAGDCANQKKVRYTNTGAKTITMADADHANCTQKAVTLQNGAATGDITVNRASSDTFTGSGLAAATSALIKPGQTCTFLADTTNLWNVTCDVPVQFTTGTANFLRQDATFAAPAGGSTLLNYQQDAAAIVGDSTDKTIYTYSMPGNTIAAGQCVRVTFRYAHTTGSAAVDYKIFFGATSAAVVNFSGASAIQAQYIICNDSGVTNAQQMSNISGQTGSSVIGAPALAFPAEDTTGAVVIKVTFNVAATDEVTPHFFLVEKVI